MTPFDCLFIGSSTQDLLMLVDESPGSDQRISASKKVFACGGPGSTAAAAFSQLGGRAALISAIGQDDTGDFIRSDLLSRNFAHLTLIEIPNASSSFSTILVEKDGKRLITCYGGCMDQMTLSMLDHELLRVAPMVHLAGLSESFLIDAVQFCRENSDALISVDGGNYSLHAAEKIIPYTDLFIPDKKTVEKTLGTVSMEKACLCYHEMGAKIVCITLGETGALAYDGEQFYSAPAAHVHVVDTTGAGDNFHGAFLYCLSQKFTIPETLRFCNTFSGLTCEGLGGRDSLPTRETVLKKMAGTI